MITLEVTYLASRSGDRHNYTQTREVDIEGELFHKRSKINPLRNKVAQKLIDQVDHTVVELIKIQTQGYSRHD